MRAMSSSMKLLRSKSTVFSLLICVITGILLLYFIHYWRVRIVRIEGIPEGVNLSGLENIKNKPMLFLSEQSVKQAIKKSNPFIGRVQVSKKYPHTLVLIMVIDRPVAYFKSDAGFFVLNSEGKIISKLKGASSSGDGLPVIHFFEKLHFSSYQSGDLLNYHDINTALRILKKISELGIKINTIDIDGVDMIGLNLKGRSVIFSSEKDVEMQVYQLRQIVHQFRIQGTDYKKIDLWFNRPVIELDE